LIQTRLKILFFYIFIVRNKLLNVKRMNVIGISGTPRKKGNSELLLKYALKPFEDNGWNVKIFLLSELEIKPCKACGSCRETGTCVINDDMQEIYNAFRWCNAIIISSPVHFLNVSAQLLALLNRHYAIDIEKPLEGKVGGAIAVGGGTSGGQTLVINAIYIWMLSCGIICVPGARRCFKSKNSVKTSRNSWIQCSKSHKPTTKRN
jgi:multimeric flavodoxin WrbA